VTHRATRIVVSSLIILTITVVTVAVALAVAWLPPTINGFHLGYNSATDNACETWAGLQFCRYQKPTVASPQR
jgi:hypothetical protein